ncbi:uncharacterized protein A4U43_C07F22080 [Asparagus officinalis]|uniref:Uncharacterized protein n=1 Tax=Asparagus officinalis TaxID=4686 RepID=A0A5P1EJ51_ASPOF|nr:uncharacterized protein A4U43_C07F22080 [Asparagus officinalis]
MPPELLGSGGIGGARDIRPDGADPDLLSEALKGGEVQTVAVAESRAHAEEVTSQSPTHEASYKPGKEPAGTSGGVGELTTPSQPPAESSVCESSKKREGNPYWPFRHWVSELEPQVWEKSKAMLMGVSSCPCSPRREFPEGDSFIPEAPLDRESSVLGSATAQI